MKRVVLCTLGVIFLFSTQIFAQTTYPDSIWIPVTYYDFHYDKSNPEFEQNMYNQSVFKGMVRTTLDSEQKPVCTTDSTKINRNAYIKYWFRPWEDTAKGDYTIPLYKDTTDGLWCKYLGTKTVNYDTAFKNIVFKDSLKFVHIGSGMYQYYNTGFFPLSDKGFKDKFSFTMEFSWTFEKKAGQNQTFNFLGDDDVWAFIDDTLKMDIGGRHGPIADSFSTSNLGNGKHRLNFFFVERHTSGSWIKITTNLIYAAPSSMNLYPSATTPDSLPFATPPAVADTIAAGTAVPIFARIFDQNNARMSDYDTSTAPITWTIKEQGGLMSPPTGTLSTGTGNQTIFTPTKAYNYVLVIATYSNNGVVLSDTVRFYTTAGSPDHITTQTVDTLNYNDTVDISSITFGSADTMRLVYPVIRDKYNNVISFANGATWTSRDTLIAKSLATANTSKGEGSITRRTDSTKSTWVVTTSGTMKDSVQVFMTTITYTALQIYIIDNGIKVIDTVTIATDASQILRARGYRSDGKGWDDIEVNWGNSTGLAVTGTPPTNARTWTVIPTAVDTGTIFISRTGSTGDTVVAIFTPGQASSMALYRKEGNPLTAEPYSIPPRIDTLVAGTNYPLDAKIFDRNSVWLSRYENSATSKSLISWAITQRNGFGTPLDTLTGTTGHLISFTPTHAYNSLTITATFKEGTTFLTASVNFYVMPGAATHLVIEATAYPTGEYLVKDNPIDTVLFNSRDTVKLAYAILRDKYGNFVSQSNGTAWTSAKTTLVTAIESNVASGEGKITRVDTAGTTYVTATNIATLALTDIVPVKVNSFSYDSLRILVGTSTTVSSLVMTLGYDTLLQVEGKRSFDGAWVLVDASWYSILSGVALDGPTNRTWDYNPSDTGKGIIYVTLGNAVPDTLAITVVPDKANSLSIYNKEGSPNTAGTTPYVSLPDSVTVSADSTLRLIAKIFDKNKIWLSAYELDPAKSSTIAWRIEENSGNTASGKLVQTAGHKTTFIPDSAYRSVLIIATITIDQITTFSDTVKVHIISGEPKQLVLEASPNWQANENTPAPVDTIKILESVTAAQTYAILRDAKGNFVRYSLSTQWGVVNNDTIITVRNGITTLGEGVVERNAKKGFSQIYAVDISGLRDSAFVNLLEYYYLQLRIITRTDTAIQSLVMNTNQDTTLLVQGLRSDTAVWEYVNNALWSNTASLDKSIKSPGVAASWKVDPIDTARGQIRVSMESDIRTIPDTIDVQFTPGPPIKITIEIITPADSLIAGNTIITVVKIYNEDGLVPGNLCFTAKDVKYTDAIGQGTGRPRPFVLIGTDTLYLSENWTDLTKEQCFYSGVDTVSTILFYATSSTDSLHAITVTLGNLTAITPPFILLPAPLDSIVLYRNNVLVGDTLQLTYLDKNIIITAVGFDKYGNSRGEEKSNWTVDTILPPITQPLNVVRIIYDATSTTENLQGLMIATSKTDTLIKGTTVVKITGPLNALQTATTRDRDGDGLLDGIDLEFSRAVILPDNFILPGMTICNDDGTTCFIVDSIYTTGTATDTIWHITFKEIVTTDPQTDWQLYVTYTTVDSLLIEGVTNFPTTDGAGPVVWSVTKVVTSLEDRTKDIITVVFSEPVVRTIDGSALSTVDVPSNIFTVWELRTINGKDTLIAIDSALTGIKTILSFDGTTLTFQTTNGVDLTSNNYISINSTTLYVKDTVGTGNIPAIKNRQTVVLIINTLPPDLVSVPNPSVPTFVRTAAGVLLVQHVVDARKWVKTDNAGTVLSFTIIVPNNTADEASIKLRCKIKIHDIAGNLVASSSSNDVIPSNVRGYASAYDIDLYWNGSNSKGMAVAPGIYKAEITLEYYNSQAGSVPSKFKNSKMDCILGIAR